MPINEGLYVWDCPWAPADALTDTPPDSTEREFLDRMTDPTGDYHITPFEIDGGYQKSYGVWNYKEARNNVFRFSEAVEFIEQFPNGWNEFRPLFDEAGVLDPLDPRDIPAAVKERMLEIKEKVEHDIGLTLKDKDYCDKFVPQFYEYGLRSFGDGGLCFRYGFIDRILNPDVEVSTAGEAFKQCTDTGINNGKCLVSTVKVFSAYEYTAPHCNMIATHAPYYKKINSKTSDTGHIFAEYKGTALDPHELGRSKDSENTMITRRQLMSEYHDTLGFVLEDKGNLIEAESEYRQAIQLREDFPEAHNNLGALLIAKWDSAGAESEFRRAIQSRENYPDAHCNLGTALAQQGDLNGAEREYRRTIRLREEFLEAHYNLGTLLKIKGQNDEAEKHFKRYRELTGVE